MEKESNISSARLAQVFRAFFRGTRGVAPPIVQCLLYLLMSIMALSMVFPFVWMISTSLKTEQQIFTYPPSWIPKPFMWKNYLSMWRVAPFARYVLNSIIVTFTGTICTLIISSMAGLSFAKYDYPGKQFIFMVIIGTLMIPGQVTLVPVFIIMKKLGWLNTYRGLIVPGLANAFAIFMMRQYLSALPTELIYVARIDGCPEIKIYYKIILPLSIPALSVLGILTFMGYWNDLFWPLIMTNIDRLKTLQLGLSLLKTAWVTRWDTLMAGATFATIPIVIAFLIFQKYFIAGIALTGFKQ